VEERVHVLFDVLFEVLIGYSYVILDNRFEIRKSFAWVMI